jgi:hypothetical protein
MRVLELAASIAGRSRIKNPNSDTVRINGERLARIEELAEPTSR